MTDRRRAIAFNALGRAIRDADHWLPFTDRQAAVDAVLIAVDRDATRQTTGQDDTKPTPWTTDGRHGPTPDETRKAIARAIHRYDAEHAFSVNDLPSEHHYGEADAVLAVLVAPAVGQPAEAHDTDRAALRERLRLAIAQQFLTDTGSGRTVGELDDTEFGSLADAALKALTVEGER